MVRITDHCCSNNLNYKNVLEDVLGDDITNEIIINTSPTTLLATVSLSRKLIKLYVVNCSNPLAVVWVRHGTGATATNVSFPLPMKHLYENTSQANRPLSVVCSEGTALLRLTVANKV